MPKNKLNAIKTFAGREPVKESSRVGQIVRQQRKASKLTQRQAAHLCGVGVRFLSDLENGKASLHFGKVLQVLKGFGLLVILKKKTLTDD